MLTVNVFGAHFSGDAATKLCAIVLPDYAAAFADSQGRAYAEFAREGHLRVSEVPVLAWPRRAGGV